MTVTHTHTLTHRQKRWCSNACVRQPLSASSYHPAGAAGVCSGSSARRGRCCLPEMNQTSAFFVALFTLCALKRPCTAQRTQHTASDRRSHCVCFARTRGRSATALQRLCGNSALPHAHAHAQPKTHCSSAHAQPTQRTRHSHAHPIIHFRRRLSRCLSPAACLWKTVAAKQNTRECVESATECLCSAQHCTGPVRTSPEYSPNRISSSLARSPTGCHSTTA